MGRILRQDELVTDAHSGEPSLLDLRSATRVELSIRDGRLVVRPRAARWFTLAELLRDGAEPQGGAEVLDQRRGELDSA